MLDPEVEGTKIPRNAELLDPEVEGTKIHRNAGKTWPNDEASYPQKT